MIGKFLLIGSIAGMMASCTLLPHAQKGPTPQEKKGIENYLKEHPNGPPSAGMYPKLNNPSKDGKSRTARPTSLGDPSKATVKISANSGSYGSGSIVSDDGIIVTAAHVAQLFTAEPAKITLPNGDTFTATVLNIDRLYDIAIMKIQKTYGKTLPQLKMSAGALTKGEPVTAWGYSHGHLAPKKLTFLGSVITGSKQQKFDLSFSCGIDCGDSGGPIVKANNEIAAVTVAKQVGGAETSYGVYIAHVKQFACETTGELCS